MLPIRKIACTGPLEQEAEYTQTEQADHRPDVLLLATSRKHSTCQRRSLQMLSPGLHSLKHVDRKAF
jgi:hypothetical protein